MTKRRCCDVPMMEHPAVLYGVVMGTKYAMDTTALVCHDCGRVEIHAEAETHEFERAVESRVHPRSKRNSTAEIAIAYVLLVVMLWFILMSLLPWGIGR